MTKVLPILPVMMRKGTSSSLFDCVRCYLFLGFFRQTFCLAFLPLGGGVTRIARHNRIVKTDRSDQGRCVFRATGCGHNIVDAIVQSNKSPVNPRDLTDPARSSLRRSLAARGGLAE